MNDISRATVAELDWVSEIKPYQLQTIVEVPATFCKIKEQDGFL